MKDIAILMAAESRGAVSLKEAKQFLAVPHTTEYVNRVSRVFSYDQKHIARMLLGQWAHLSLTTRPKFRAAAARLRKENF
jgi:hypothetical protein